MGSGATDAANYHMNSIAENNEVNSNYGEDEGHEKQRWGY